MKDYLMRLIFLLALFFAVAFRAVAQPATVPKSNPVKIYMHYMPWFDAPHNPVVGQNYSWGWHWTMNTRNPNIVDANGRRQIASHYYPLIGAYASNDPHVVEYHLLLMKLSGIDGVIMDWYGSEGSNGDVGSLLNNSNALINRTAAVGVKFSLILEDRFWGNIQHARNSLAYARNNYFNRSNYIRHGSGNDPLVGVFGPITHQTPSAWSDILGNAGEDVEFLPLWYESGDAGASADGEYAWIYSDYLTGLQNFYANRAPGLKTAMGVAYPGFNDYYVQGGAGQSYFFIPENNGATLNETITKFDQHKANLDFLQLATWNDFGEGTIFEPTVENGFKYLVRIQQYAGVSYNENDLRNVHRLFMLRKKYLNDGAKQSQLNTAFDHFVALRLNDAVAVMNAVDGQQPPPSTIAIPGTLQAESYSAMNGIQTENTTDGGGGQNVGWIDANDWMDYNVNITTAGTYNISFRVASGTAGGQLQLRRGTTVLATVNITGTGGWQNWTTLNTTATLSAGTQTLRLHAVSGGYNVNWVQFSTGTPPPPTGTSYRIKNRWQNTYLYDAGDRVRYNATASGNTYQWVLEDVGGGVKELKNVGTGEYMHIENLTGYVQCTARTSGWSSSRWTTQDSGGGFVRIKNVWQGSSYIHVENLAAHAQYGTINTAWMSAQWLLEPVTGGRLPAEAESEGEDLVDVWPTIVERVLNVCTDGSYRSVEVIDLLGRTHHYDNMIKGKKSLTIDVSHLSGGIHLVKLRGSHNTRTFRVIKR
jgi:hypothetical protein